jgi:hypothetical protein
VTSEPSSIISEPARLWSALGESPRKSSPVPRTRRRRRAGPDEDVADDGRDETDADDVRELRARPEPLGRGERLEDREPEDDPGSEEGDVLERVEAAVLDGALVQHGHVPATRFAAQIGKATSGFARTRSRITPGRRASGAAAVR